MISRREFLHQSGAAYIATAITPMPQLLASEVLGEEAKSVRCINVVNFLRGSEPRNPMDLFLPLQKQMEISLQLDLPTTWLLQYDALVSGPFVPYLKEKMAKNHEVGVWFEMNEKHCKAAGVVWRGRPGFDWDHFPHVAFTIGYSKEERIQLADAFMSEFKKVWGAYPKSVASWNLDSITMEYLVSRYKVDAFAVCRDQIATDGFTIWGAPIAGYYSSKKNCWSPALSRKEQISSPVFRMLGQAPVYYFENGYPMPGGKRGGGPDTMEPVWPSGRSPIFIKNFLDMISKAPTLDFAYAQLGQENNFGWPEMEQAYPVQMKALADLRDKGLVYVETMGDSGRRFKKAFRETPAQAQVMLVDSFGNTDRVENSIWYQSRFYRANLHLKGDRVYLRDITVYSDEHPQPFLTQATRLHDVEQRMPAVLDGFRWSKTPGSAEPGAGGFFKIDGEELRLSGRPEVVEERNTMTVNLPVQGERSMEVKFEEKKITVKLSPANAQSLVLSFEWDPNKSSLKEVGESKVFYKWEGLDYSVKVEGLVKQTPTGWSLASVKSRSLAMHLAQPR